MAFRLKTGEKFAQGIRRIARKEIKAIVEHLEGRRGEDEGRAVHEARKDLKKMRALLRLVRDQLGEEVYERENRDFREVGRALSPRRDAQVLAKTLEKLHRRSSSQTTRAALAKLEKVVLGRLQQALESGNGCRDLKPLLESSRCRAENWPLGKLKWADVCGGLRQGYRRARKALKVAGETRADEDLHQWRKRVKDMWYQLGLVQSVCPKAVTRMADKMKELSEYLGDDHDFMMLAGAAKNAGLGSEEAQSVLDWIQGQRHRLQTSAFHLGRKLFAEKPGQFAGRMADYWKGRPGL